MPQTTTEAVHERGERVLELVGALLERSALHSVIDPGSSLVVIGADMAWNELDDEGRRIQARLLKELERYLPLVSALRERLPTTLARPERVGAG
jgi:hypothetical protein